MFRTLRTRLILSHILPALLIIPLMGAVMVYILETRLLLPMVYRNLEKDATLMAEITRNQPVFWENREAAQALVDGVNPYLSGTISLINLNGQIQASSRVTAGGVGSELVELPDLTNVVQGQTIQLMRGPLAEVFAPVYNLNSQRIGIIRMTTRVVSVTDEVYQMRYILVGILLASVLVGVGFGSTLAFTINKPIERVTRSIRDLARGNWQTHLPEDGPEEVRLLAVEVNTLIDRLKNLEKNRQQLLANLVHELGRPLGALRSASQALLKGADQDPELRKDLLVGIDGEIARLQILLNDLAGLHDQLLGKIELQRQEITIHEWLPGILSPWRVEAEQKDLDWQIRIQPKIPFVKMDPDRMAQAIGNLLSNAIKFTPPGGTIHVEVECTSDELVTKVSDTGIGIPLEEQTKIFEPFYHGAQKRRVVEGMGLGLNIARQIVEAHSGKLELVSSPELGSCFTIRIPIV